jgi:hypothetical protein
MLLAMLITPRALKIVTAHGVIKTLDPNNDKGFKNSKGVEDLSLEEKMFMGVTKRYLRIEARTQALEDFKK